MIELLQDTTQNLQARPFVITTGTLVLMAIRHAGERSPRPIRLSSDDCRYRSVRRRRHPCNPHVLSESRHSSVGLPHTDRQSGPCCCKRCNRQDMSQIGWGTRTRTWNDRIRICCVTNYTIPHPTVPLTGPLDPSATQTGRGVLA